MDEEPWSVERQRAAAKQAAGLAGRFERPVYVLPA